MIGRLLTWLGLGGRPRPNRKNNGRSRRPTSATAHLFEKKPVPKSNPAASAGGDFNPYNTGKFDRSASWEHISKNQR
jgi:hypothetical protein